MLEIRQIPVLEDNYVYLVHEPVEKLTAVVDPAVTDEVMSAAASAGWTITHILNTHHHFDHVGGNEEIRDKTGCTIVGPRADRDRIPGIEIELGDGDLFQFGAATARVFDVPGHTKGHIAYWFEADKALFCGDTLFALGCGRMFEGTPGQFWPSLKKLRDLPDETRVFCAHEYTQANARFALSIDPDNVELTMRSKEIDALRAHGIPTVPSVLAAEKATNPFLRADQPEIAAQLGMEGRDPIDIFAEIRHRKDNF
ncbi:hydroxyacylglutathione hydrolase [Aestuariispira insulae]|uniref:Hydroxyacylglutathione hydrolase n=1 Tax=Aestuariispira insulae TaxID=1461337 RepID=A0A3D9HP27_9PROT|nr:hydroxyacylglutathione hydrolase [Aestuariispira insulae]RED51254.1 hydroxyacylglutathione hydrolase [Aestuariispira insulae]